MRYSKDPVALADRPEMQCSRVGPCPFHGCVHPPEAEHFQTPRRSRIIETPAGPVDINRISLPAPNKAPGPPCWLCGRYVEKAGRQLLCDPDEAWELHADTHEAEANRLAREYVERLAPLHQKQVARMAARQLGLEIEG